MRSPVRTLRGNLRWTRAGTVWADYLLTPLPYGFRPVPDKFAVRSLHQALFRALPGESLLQGVSCGIDAATVVERMIEGVDLGACADWAAECEATLDTLDAISPGQRIFWLSVPLGARSTADRIRGPWTSAVGGMRDALALPLAAVPDAEVARRVEQARRVASAIPRMFRPRPATPAQMLWLHLHAQQRGATAGLDLPQAGPGGETAARLLTPRPGSSLPEPLLDEGGQSDLTRQLLRRFNPADRRYLKITQPTHPQMPAASYQSLLVMTDEPADGMVFPGSEFLGRIDESGLEVDWAIRLQVLGSSEVAAKNRRALNNLNEQYDQREGHQRAGHAHSTGPLDRAARELAEYADVLDSDKFEVEVQPTLIFAVAGPDPQTTTDRARSLASYFADADCKLTAPLGYQEALWWAMQPGTPATAAVREFARITTSRGLATTVPLASTALGDDRGSLLALNISSGRPGVVLHDVAGASARDVSGSVAAIGELGSGKSFLLKKMAGDVVDRGGRVIAVDRTHMGEYARWASSVTAATVVDIGDPVVSLDPLRLFGAKVGSRVTQTFLTPLLNIAPTSEGGVLLSEVLDPDYLTRHHVGSLGELLRHLSNGCDLPGAGELGRVMNVYARKDFGAVVFDETLPVLEADATPAVVVRTQTLALPSREELTHKHLFDQMSLEKAFGRAIYALVASLARHICFADPSRLGVFVVDEAHHVTASPEGEHEIAVFARDGRKHSAAALLGTHDPEEDLGSQTLRGLIPTRILMRHRDKTLAARGLAYLGLDPQDNDLLQMLTEDTSPVTARGVEEHRRGEAFMRDSSGNIGRIKVLPPALAHRDAAVRTSPPTSLTGTDSAVT